MIDVTHAPADRRLNPLERGVRMAGVAADAARTAGTRERFRARQFGGDGRRGDAVGEVEEGQIVGRLRRTDGRAGVTAARLRSEIGSIEMSAENGRAARALRLQSAAHIKKGEMLLVPGNGGRRQQTGRAVEGVRAADGAESIG